MKYERMGLVGASLLPLKNVIAEGIEDLEMAERLQSLGVHLMQGYYFGKPNSQMTHHMNDSLIQLGNKVGYSKIESGMTIPVVS